jgi:hypothetical protein
MTLSWRRSAAAATRDRFDASVLKARRAGFSWSELGVSKQQLHRRFGTRQQG